MTLRITKASDPIEVKTITIVVYAEPGIGKSTLGFTANKPLLLDFDKGSHRAANRGDTVQIESWTDVTSITAADLADYKTLIVDTAGRALDFLTIDIIKNNPKAGRGGGALTISGYGDLKTMFTAWMKWVRSLGIDIVLVAHSDEQRKGDDVFQRLDIQGGSKNEVYKTADSMGRLYWAGQDRMLNFNPTDIAFGKNPASLPAMKVPHYAAEPLFLGGLVDGIKGELNKRNAVQVLATQMMDAWKVKLDNLVTLDDFNNILAGQDKPDQLVKSNVKKMLSSAAKKRGFTFDTKSNLFVPVLVEGKAA